MSSSGNSWTPFHSLNIWKFMVQVLLKLGLENFEHYFASLWDECNCVVVWIFFGIAFLLDWNENWPFPVLWPQLSFPNLLASWVQHFHQHHLLGFEIVQVDCHHLISDLQMTPPYGWKWRVTKETLDESEKENEKVGLKLNIQKTKIMASGPISSWQIDGKQWKQYQK